MNSTCKRTLLIALIPLLSMALPIWVSEGQRSGQMVPAKAEFSSDNSGGHILSDTLGAYINKSDCVTANISAEGRFYLRTVKSGCVPTTSRQITIDFTNALLGSPECPIVQAVQCPGSESLDDLFGQAGTLNACGSNMLEDVTIVAQRLFVSPIPTSGLTEVQIRINLEPDFRNTAFYLNGAAYIQAGSTANERILTTGADQTEFGLFERYTQKGKTTTICLGNYSLPFTLKVTKL